MKLTLTQWKALEAKAQLVRDALGKLAYEIGLVQESQIGQSDDRDQAATNEHLFKMQDYVGAAMMSISNVLNGTHVVGEWTGGDSSDPKNTKLREPVTCYGGLSARRYFTTEEVAEWQATLGKQPPAAPTVPSIVPPAPPRSSASQ